MASRFFSRAMLPTILPRILVVSVVPVVLVTLGMSITIIPANHVGHTNLFGDISKKKLSPGLSLVNPSCSVVKIPLLTNICFIQ